MVLLVYSTKYLKKKLYKHSTICSKNRSRGNTSLLILLIQHYPHTKNRQNDLSWNVSKLLHGKTKHPNSQHNIEDWQSQRTLPDFKTYYEAPVPTTVRCWWKTRQIGQWRRAQLPETDPQKYSQLSKAIQWRKG